MIHQRQLSLFGRLPLFCHAGHGPPLVRRKTAWPTNPAALPENIGAGWFSRPTRLPLHEPHPEPLPRRGVRPKQPITHMTNTRRCYPPTLSEELDFHSALPFKSAGKILAPDRDASSTCRHPGCIEESSTLREPSSGKCGLKTSQTPCVRHRHRSGRPRPRCNRRHRLHSSSPPGHACRRWRESAVPGFPRWDRRDCGWLPRAA